MHGHAHLLYDMARHRCVCRVSEATIFILFHVDKIQALMLIAFLSCRLVLRIKDSKDRTGLLKNMEGV